MIVGLEFNANLMFSPVPDLGMGHRGHGPGASTNWGPPPTKKIFFDLTYCCRQSAIAKQGARGPPRTHWPWGLHIGKSGPGCSIFHSYFPNILLTAVDWIRTFPGFESSTWLIDEIATQILCSNNLAAVCIILRHECRHSGRLFHVIQRLSMTNARNSHMKCCIFAHLNANVFSSILIRKFINGMSHAHFRAISTSCLFPGISIFVAKENGHVAGDDGWWWWPSLRPIERCLLSTLLGSD